MPRPRAALPVRGGRAHSSRRARARSGRVFAFDRPRAARVGLDRAGTRRAAARRAARRHQGAAPEDRGDRRDRPAHAPLGRAGHDPSSRTESSPTRSGVVEDFEANIREELDFRREAANMVEFNRIMVAQRQSRVAAPRVFAEPVDPARPRHGAVLRPSRRRRREAPRLERRTSRKGCSSACAHGFSA